MIFVLDTLIKGQEHEDTSSTEQGAQRDANLVETCIERGINGIRPLVLRLSDRSAILLKNPARGADNNEEVA